MNPPRGPVRRLFGLGVNAPRVDESVDWEIEHHLQEICDLLESQGWTPEKARAEAERRFGDLRQHERELQTIDRGEERMRRGMEIATGIGSTLGRTLRTARRSPSFAAGVVLTLGLGLGVNAAMYGIVDRLLLSPPDHVVDPDGLRRVYLDRDFIGERVLGPTLTYPDLSDLREVPEFASVGAYTRPYGYTVGSGEDAERVELSMASHDFFATLGASTHLGRFYTGNEDRAGEAATVVLGYEYWVRSHGADPEVLGSSISVRGAEHTIVGVAPAGFTGIDLEPVDIWAAIEASSAAIRGSDSFKEQRGSWWLQTVVRLASPEAETPGFERATARLRQEREEEISAGHFDGMAALVPGPLMRAATPQASGTSEVARWLGGVSLVVLLIACANVANLLLARGAGRRREVAVRMALGVSRPRLIAEHVLETLLLALVGGGVALALAHWGGVLLRNALLPDVLWTAGALDSRLVTFTLVLSLAAGLLAGVGPALQSSRVEVTRDLRDGGWRGSGRTSRVRSSLAGFQAALSAVLLVGAGLFVKSLDRVGNIDLGIEADRIAMVELEFATSDVDATEAHELYGLAATHAHGVPGVASVASTDTPLMWAFGESVRVPGRDSIPRLSGGGPYRMAVSADYFGVAGVRITRGRSFTEADATSGEKIVVISESMADALWPGGEALGQCVLRRGEDECTTVVGVAEDATRGSLLEDPYMLLYYPQTERGAPRALFVRASADDVDEVVGAVSSALRGLSPRVRFVSVQSLEEMLAPQAESWRLGATLFLTFGLLASLVAAIGLYGLLSFNVAARYREIGIRRALGAATYVVFRQVLRAGTRVALLGVVLGLVLAYAAAPRIEGLLFEVPGRDPSVFLGVAGLLLVISLTAALVPGLRASRVDPIEALADE